MSDTRLLLWQGLDDWRAEAARVELTARGIAATGTQIGTDPLHYRLDYRLEALDGFATQSLLVQVSGQGWQRRLDLRRDGDGWTCAAAADGSVDQPEPGGEMSPLSGALDCDLGLSPLTNAMPILRSGLDREAGAGDFLMAWVSVPDLAVHASPQRYEHVRRSATGSVVRFVDRGLFEGFEAELELDADGFVERYPDLAERVSAGQPRP